MYSTLFLSFNLVLRLVFCWIGEMYAFDVISRLIAEFAKIEALCAGNLINAVARSANGSSIFAFIESAITHGPPYFGYPRH